jgi:hypothetical protein
MKFGILPSAGTGLSNLKNIFLSLNTALAGDQGTAPG